MRVVVPAAVAAALVALGAAACGGGWRTCLPGAGTSAVQVPGGRLQAFLTAVSVTRAGCVHRVSFAFAHRLPGYRVEYLPPARAKTEDASGRRLRIAGSAFLVVRFDGALTARSDGGTVEPTYAGPRRLPVRGGAHAREVVKTGDFEAVVTWAIGLDGRRPFAVHASGRSLDVEIA